VGDQLSVDRPYLLRWCHPIGRCSDEPASHLTMETGHANHEKFIQIRGEDRQKLHAFQEGMPLVLGFFQDPQIELQPAELTIQEGARFIENL
jgi:hypothetical protein